MKITKTVVGVLFFLVSTSAFAQEIEIDRNVENQKWDISLEGMVGFSAGRDFYALNVGGPALFLILNENLKVGIGALPALYVLEGKAGARLGVSPRVDYKNLVFIAPFFHRDVTNQWIWSVGLGYKFYKKK